MFTRDYYNRRYREVDKKRRCTGLYEESIKSHISRMEGLLRQYVKCPPLAIYRSFYSQMTLSRYCKLVNNDPYYTLKKSPAGRINIFFLWMYNEYIIRKVSFVTTYWHQLSQVYTKYKGRRIGLLVLKKVYEVCYPGRKITL